MLKFYYNTGPNPMKVALFLEETGMPYEAIPVDGRKGDQHTPAYKALNPNAKAPTLVDGETVVFDSNAILLYLGRKSGQFMPPPDDKSLGEMLSWLMFVATGVGPYSGQSVHFRHHAPEQLPYAIQRYMFEARRHYQVLDDRLATQPYMLSGGYSIVDMAVWGWARLIPFVLGPEVPAEMPHLKRLIDEINARSAAQRAEAIKNRFAFKAEMDEEARRNMFPSAFAAR
jgi:GST-like protein